jgi:hypothetical protein
MEAMARVGTALMGIGGIVLVLKAILVFADAVGIWLQVLAYGVLGVGLCLWAIGVLLRPKPGSTE